MRAWTDYPLLPGEEGKIAPVRQVKVIGYDHDKYCQVLFDDKPYEVKRGYVFAKKGRVGQVPCLNHDRLTKEFPVSETSDGESK